MGTIFGRKLRNIRTAKGKTMGALARALNVSVPFVSDVELGRRPPLSPERIAVVAELLEIDPTELLTAASRERGSVVLPTNSDKRQETAAALLRGWPQFEEADLEELRKVAEDLQRKRGITK